MIHPASKGPSVVVCGTCRLAADRREDAAGRRGGPVLAAEMHSLRQANARYAGIDVEEMPCLFACTRHCVVHVRAPGKIAYLLGDFAADKASAQAILDYAVHYAASAEGDVRYADWPDGVKGHFIARFPPEGAIVA